MQRCEAIKQGVTNPYLRDSMKIDSNRLKSIIIILLINIENRRKLIGQSFVVIDFCNKQSILSISIETYRKHKNGRRRVGCI